MQRDTSHIVNTLTKTRSRRVALFLAFVLIGFVGVAVATTTLTTDPYVLSEGVTLDATDGPEITLDETIEIDRKYPVEGGTVNLLPLAKFTAEGDVEATVSGLEDTWLILEDVALSSYHLTIESANHADLTVSGGATELQVRDFTPDDDNADLYLETEGETVFDLSELPTHQTYVTLWNDTTQLDRDVIDDGGNATLSTSTSGDLFLKTEDPSFTDASPADGEFVDQQHDIPLNVTINHPALTEGDQLDVTFYDASDGSEIGSDTLHEPGEASTTWTPDTLGDQSWFVEVDDQDGTDTTSDTWDFTTPHNLTIRDEETTDRITGEEVEVSVTFFPGGGDETITRTTTDGNISLQGLPHDTEIVALTSAEGYHTREAVIRDLSHQMTVWLLNESADTVQVEFRLEDATGDFPEGESRLLIYKPITMDGETSYKNIVGQEFGIGGAQVWLEAEQRYRIEVEGPDGDRRTLGTFSPSVATTHTLQIESREVSIAPPEHELGFRWDVDATIADDDDDNHLIELAYQDDEDVTDELNIRIYDRSNPDRVIVDESHFDVTNLTASWEVPDEYQNVSSWTVEIHGVYDGEPFTASKPVDIHLETDLPIPDWLISVASVLILLFTAALFGGRRADLGGIVVAVLAGFMYLIGFLPGSVSGTFIVLALLFAVVYRHGSGAGGAQPV